MRITDRIRRLEQHVVGEGRMTRAELDAAAQRFEEALGANALPIGATVDQARAAWQGLVYGTGPAWQQRVFANAQPADLFA